MKHDAKKLARRLRSHAGEMVLRDRQATAGDLRIAADVVEQCNELREALQQIIDGAFAHNELAGDIARRALFDPEQTPEAARRRVLDKRSKAKSRPSSKAASE